MRVFGAFLTRWCRGLGGEIGIDGLGIRIRIRDGIGSDSGLELADHESRTRIRSSFAPSGTSAPDGLADASPRKESTHKCWYSRHHQRVNDRRSTASWMAPASEARRCPSVGTEAELETIDADLLECKINHEPGPSTKMPVPQNAEPRTNPTLAVTKSGSRPRTGTARRRCPSFRHDMRSTISSGCALQLGPRDEPLESFDRCGRREMNFVTSSVESSSSSDDAQQVEVSRR